MKNNYDYDVAFSFAGEDREYVENVANYLKNKYNIRVFYDNFFIIELWGKDLYTHLTDVYKNKSKYVIVFASENYAKKLWTNHERKVAQARAFEENREYILPARFDKTEIPGILDTTGYIDLRSVSEVEFAKMIVEKVGNNDIDTKIISDSSTQNDKNIINEVLPSFVSSQQTRKRDITVLKKILMNFELSVFDYFFNQVPQMFNYNIIYHFDNLTEVINSLNYHLYDLVLKEKIEKIHELQHEFTTYSPYYINIGNFRFKLNSETPSDKVQELENICIEMHRNFSEFIKIIRKDWIEIDLDKIQCSIKDEIRAYEKRIEGNTSIYKNPYSENIKKLDNLFLKVKQTVYNYFNDVLYYPELTDRIKEWRKEIVNINNCHQETGVSDFERHQRIENLITKVTLICDSLEITNFGKNKELINRQINNFLFERGQL